MGPVLIAVGAAVVLGVGLIALADVSGAAAGGGVGAAPGVEHGPGAIWRRTDPRVPGAAGELARAANVLAEDLETRASKAQEDSDHLLSLLAVLDHTNEIAIATDNMDVIRLANPAAARVLERPTDELLGGHIDTVIHHPDLRALYRNAFSTTRPVSAGVAPDAGRTLHCQATAATIYNGAHYRGTLLVLRDITDQAQDAADEDGFCDQCLA